MMYTSFLSRDHTKLWWAVRCTFYIVWQIASWNEVHHCEMSWLIKNLCWICAHLWDRGSFSLQGRVELFTAFLAGTDVQEDLGHIWASSSGKPEAQAGSHAAVLATVSKEAQRAGKGRKAVRPWGINQTSLGKKYWDVVWYCKILWTHRTSKKSWCLIFPPIFAQHQFVTWTVGNHSSRKHIESRWSTSSM